MELVKSIKAWVGEYRRGDEPRAYTVDLRVCRAAGRLFLVTPWACLDFWGDDVTDADIMRQAGAGYFSSESEAWAMLKARYPHAERNQPIMEALLNAIRWDGDVVGPGRLADKLGVSVFWVHDFARGLYRASDAQIKAARGYAGRPV